ncbi:MAG: YHS domain-containing (seleno)protein [Pseudomonadota bacterium]
MEHLKTLVLTALISASIVAGAPVWAADEYNVSKGTTVDGNGVAFRGNDLVAIQSGLGVVPGRAEFTHVHDGVAYYFASAVAQQEFASDPDKFMPQYGGYCTLGVALGKKLDASPRFADIVDGKLYVFLNAAVFEAYQEDKAGVLQKAAENWPEMQHVAVAEINGTGS